MEKYFYKYRQIIISTPDKENKYYKEAISQLKNNKKKFDMLSTIIKINNSNIFSIKLYGLDGTLKYKTNKFTTWNKFIDLIRNMPMEKIAKNLSLYADYHPRKSMKNLGFKNKEVAENTLLLIKNKPKVYQFLVINTMYNRAKYHPNQTSEMKDAMKIFKKWLNNYKKS
jgi:hypothetical protein